MIAMDIFKASQAKHASSTAKAGLAHYAKLRIDAHTKRMVFSDSLNITKALELYQQLADRTQLDFDIGTSLSNNMGRPTLHIVMKLSQANGQPVAKLSDSPGKTMCNDQTFLVCLHEVSGIPAPQVAGTAADKQYSEAPWTSTPHL